MHSLYEEKQLVIVYSTVFNCCIWRRWSTNALGRICVSYLFMVAFKVVEFICSYILKVMVNITVFSQTFLQFIKP